MKATVVTRDAEIRILECYAASVAKGDALILAIAKELGAVAVVGLDMYGNLYELALESGFKVTAATGGTWGAKKGMIAFSARYPNEWPGPSCLGKRSSDSASFSATRNPAVIAAGVKARVIPGMVANAAELERLHNGMKERAGMRDGLAKDLAGILGSEARGAKPESLDGRGTVSVNPPDRSLYGDFEVSPGAMVDIRLRNVDAELACKIAEVLAEAIGKEVSDA